MAMSDVLTLAESFYDCPTCWQNFIAHVRKKHKLDELEGFLTEDIIDKELSQFNGLYFEKATHCCVLFDTPEYKTLFMLKYG
jgi:hypothetical protein